VHKEWLNRHDFLPTSKAEKKEYNALVQKEIGDVGKIVETGTQTVSTATHCNKVQHTAPYCNTLQHTATHCNTL